MIIKQLLVGPLDVFCYLLGCEVTREAVVIDPGGSVKQIVLEAEKNSLTVRYIVNTHRHGDHIAANAELKKRTGAQIIMHALDAVDCPGIDIHWRQQTNLQVGKINLQILHTPGHTPGGICLYVGGHLFTGDSLFVGDSGRTDLPGGDRAALGVSLRQLMKLPEETVVWPGHDYGPKPNSTIAWEKKNNVNAKEYGYFEG